MVTTAVSLPFRQSLAGAKVSGHHVGSQSSPKLAGASKRRHPPVPPHGRDGWSSAIHRSCKSPTSDDALLSNELVGILRVFERFGVNDVQASIKHFDGCSIDSVSAAVASIEDLDC